MKIITLILIFITSVCYADIYQWKDSEGVIHYSDTKPQQVSSNKIKLREPVHIKNAATPNQNETRIIAWEVTDHRDSHITVAVKYFYDGKYKDEQIWLSAHTLDNRSRSMNYSVRPSKIAKGTGIVNIRLGVNSRAPKRHCTNQMAFSMYGKDIPTFHEAKVNFSKCWTNNYIAPSKSSPSKGIE